MSGKADAPMTDVREGIDGVVVIDLALSPAPAVAPIVDDELIERLEGGDLDHPLKAVDRLRAYSATGEPQWAIDLDAAVELQELVDDCLAALRRKAAPPAILPGSGEVDPKALLDEIASRITVFRDMAPEEHETWESWYLAAFDMLADEVRTGRNVVLSAAPDTGVSEQAARPAVIDEIEAGLAGVTPGPWCSEPSDIPGHGAEFAVRSRDGEVFWEIAECFGSPGPNDETAAANAAHIARCSPDNIRAWADYTRSLEARLAKE